MNEYDFLLIHLISLHPHDFVIQTYDFYVYNMCCFIKIISRPPDLPTYSGPGHQWQELQCLGLEVDGFCESIALSILGCNGKNQQSNCQNKKVYIFVWSL